MRRRIAAAVTLVVLTGIWLGAFSVASFQDSGQHQYPLDFRGATWIGTGDQAPRAYFLLQLPLHVTPDTATLWIDADQAYSVTANDVAVALDSKAVRQGALITAQPVDLTQRLRDGDNTVGVRATNFDGRPATIRARLTLINGTNSVDYLTGTATWRATSDVGQVSHRTGEHLPRYTNPAFDPSGLPLAKPVAAVRGDVPSTVPGDVIERPYSAQVVSGPNLTSDITARVAIDLPDDPTDAWFRIIAPGRYVLLLDGSALTVRATPPPVVAQIYNLGPYLHRGHNVLAVHVIAEPSAAVYAEGSIQMPNRPPVTLATGREWVVGDAPVNDPSPTGQLPGGHGSVLGTPAQYFPAGFTNVVFGVGKLVTPPGTILWQRIGFIAGLLALWMLFAGVVARVGGVALSAALSADGAAHVPVAATIAMLEVVGRFVRGPVAYPYVPATVFAVVGFLLCTKLLAAAVMTGTIDRLTRWFPLWLRPRGLGALRRRLRGHWASASIIGAMALLLGLIDGYRLDYEPYWQDEIASLNAAQGMRSHIIPQLPSGFVYWKGELYSAVIAVVGAIFGDQPGTLRVVTVVWYVATVLAFGMFLLPLIIGRGRRLLQVATTFAFAIAPVELTWARDVRMYQQAQFFVVVFLGLFLLALRDNRTRMIAASAVALVLMYLSHEETFVFLPAVPVVFLGAMRLRWVRDRRWWLMGGGAFAVIAGQYLLATLSHPPYFGFDHSNKPYVVYDPHNFFYYFRQVYFAVKPKGASLMVLTSLGLLASVVGVVRRSFERLYVTAFLWIPVLALSTVFSPKIGRYVYVTVPLLFILGALGAVDLLGLLHSAFTPVGASVRQATLVRRYVAAAMLPGFIWVVSSMTGGFGDYGLVAATAAGIPTSRKHVDFDYTIDQVRPRILPTDTVVTLCPPDIAVHYLGRKPDYIIATGRDKLLYLMETDGRVVDTTYGAVNLFSAADLQQVIQTHNRVWLITDQGSYLQGVDHRVSDLVLSEFDPVSEGYGSTVFFRGD